MTVVAPAPNRVAIVKPCCIGDCVMTLPSIDAVSAHWPDARIDVFVGDHSRSVFCLRPEIQTRPIADRLSLHAALRLASVLRRDRYDLVICLDRSRWLRAATMASRVGVVGRVKSMRPERRHESEVYLDAVRALGVPTPFTTPRITMDVADRRPIQDAGLPIAILHPGGASNPGVEMAGKRWPAERYAAIARSLEATGLEVYLSGNLPDNAVAREVAAEAKLPDSRLLVGTLDLAHLVAALRQAALFVGPDTGVSHLAAAVGTPTIAIFGPTNPRRYRPLGQNVQVVAPVKSWSIPDRDLRRRRAPQSVSTREVTVEMVWQACRTAVGTVP
jgi:ADP-heptose:LPS heptosyltransferase